MQFDVFFAERLVDFASNYRLLYPFLSDEGECLFREVLVDVGEYLYVPLGDALINLHFEDFVEELTHFFGG